MSNPEKQNRTMNDLNIEELIDLIADVDILRDSGASQADIESAVESYLAK